MNISSRIALAGASCAFAISFGCGGAPAKTYPVAGRVLFDGRPVAGAWVVFEPDDATKARGARFAARGATDAAGRFSLTTFAPQDGATAGHYRVAVLLTHELLEIGESPRMPSLVLPAHYGAPASSGLIFEVHAQANECLLELSSATAP